MIIIIKDLIFFCFSPVLQERSGPEPSCVSMKSDASINQPILFKSGDEQPGLR